ncbi:unnamed protein product [Urochloa decumbens]|uniref:Uncharacterized protein n=1 Tax=Urochloa decumbens TaxID=240449 RepID=A0ABC9AS27_9POAL
MASSAAILRSAARSLRLRQPLDQQGCLLPRRSIEVLSPTARFLSSSVPTERHPSEPSSRDSKGQKSRNNEKKDDIYERLSTKADKILDGLDEQKRLLKQVADQMNGLDEQKRLLKQVEDQMKENKHGEPIDLTPWVVFSFVLFVLYNFTKH